VQYLEGGEHTRDAATQAIEYAKAVGNEDIRDGKLVFSRNEVKLLAPVPRPTSIRDFFSFEQHATRNLGPKPDIWFETPFYYKGNPATVISPDMEIPWPSYTKKLDCELELGLYIGRRGKNIRKDQAASHIGGFTIFNDVSCRDVPGGFPWMGPGKSKDACNIMGPVLVTPDEIDPTNLRMTVRVNKEAWFDGSTKPMYWTWQELIEYASMEEELQPGDFLAAGPPHGACAVDHERWVRPGDVVELEIEGIGVLRNTIGPQPPYRSPKLRSRGK
ncbi:MAG: fumarylacetoacetate hydrolase family protein, partial [Chloroflexi bacterium]|nr:fumarylacetoacetate hydrolase family protein [Chloroflexota bacterium]